VAVEEEDADIGPRPHDLGEDHRDAAGLADAGRAEDGEVLGNEVVDVDMRGDRALVVVELANVDRAPPGGGVDHP
jgi:hypothetical protein